MRYGGSTRKRVSVFIRPVVIICAIVAGIGFFTLNVLMRLEAQESTSLSDRFGSGHVDEESQARSGTERRQRPCVTVEQMGKAFKGGGAWKESLRVRKVIQDHFNLNGASRVRQLPPEQFCTHGFVMGKASEAGFGNEMYKILTAGALSIMLNRSLIIGQTRGKFPFGDYVSYSDISFTLKEIKHLWRLKGCDGKFNRPLVMRVDNFEKPAQTNVLCSNWKEWEHPIIWFQGTTDAVAAQFFLKNVHPTMRTAASNLFGETKILESRPNVFGELMRILIFPSKEVEEAVSSVLKNGVDPDISLHMRMLMNRPVRAIQAALQCVRKTMIDLPKDSKPKLVLVSDTPSFAKSIMPILGELTEVVHFDYEHFKGNISGAQNGFNKLGFRVKDWGPSPRWVAFVDFFLASRAKRAVISGAHRRVGTTYAQLIAALAASHNLDSHGTDLSAPKFSFLSSFQSNLLREGLKNQVGWGHVWNRFAGPLSCHSQPNQCALTPLLPPAWWDELWQSPLPRDINRMADYGVHVSGFGTVNEDSLRSFCNAKKKVVRTIPFIL